jgi:Flp pilus assembly protein TadG
MRHRNIDVDSGSSLVEFAILAPLLIVLVLGIVEFGWLFGQYNEIRHGAQEGARWGAVSGPDIDGSGISVSDLVQRVCDSTDLAAGTDVFVGADPGGAMKGDTGSITVTARITPLTGAPVISAFLPDSLTSTATFRLEQEAAWALRTIPGVLPLNGDC